MYSVVSPLKSKQPDHSFPQHRELQIHQKERINNASPLAMVAMASYPMAL